jgi:rubredoxin-NAD+ reductase
MNYTCPCGYEYNEVIGEPQKSVAPGTKWENVPDDFVCPVCGLDKESFSKE